MVEIGSSVPALPFWSPQVALNVPKFAGVVRTPGTSVALSWTSASRLKVSPSPWMTPLTKRPGSLPLFGPAPAGLDEAQSDRPMMPVLGGRAVADDEVDAFLERQRSFDPDVWIVEVEARDGRHFLDDWIIGPAG